MRYHELEASIDTIKKMKATSDDSLNNFLPTARGPKGSRYVPVREKEVVQEEEEGNFIMNVPEVPAKQKAYSDNKKPPAPKKKPETATDSPKKGPGRPPKAKLESSAPKEEKRKSDPVVAHFCNCPNCDRK
jgi:hypothetical protein